MENRKRSLVKAFTWRALAIIMTVLVSFLILRNWYYSLSIGFAVNVVKIFFYYIHERMWNGIKWGKINA